MEVEAKELMASGGDYMSAMREALALKVKAEQEAANPVTTIVLLGSGILMNHMREMNNDI